MNASDFWAMGGFAVFVWPAYAVGILVLLWNWLAPGLRRRALLRELAEDADAGVVTEVSR